MTDLTTADDKLTSLLRHLPRNVRTLIAMVDVLRDGWEAADDDARYKLWSAVDDAREAVLPSTDPDVKRVLDEVAAERKQQDERWGVQDIPDFERISILTEEVGELAKAANEANFTTSPTRGDRTQMREEAIQVAAVAVDIAQSIDRRPPAAPAP